MFHGLILPSSGQSATDNIQVAYNLDDSGKSLTTVFTNFVMINPMRNSDSPYLTDLFAISLRWLALFGLAISLGMTQVLNAPLTIIVLVLPALWNGFVSALGIFNRRLVWHRMINVVLDVLFSFALYLAVGRQGGMVFWVALMPLFSAAIYFEWRGALVITFVMLTLQVLHALLINGGDFSPVAMLPLLAFNLALGIPMAIISVPLVRRLRRSYQTRITQRKESERQVQRQERDRMRALFEMIETFSSTLNYQTVLDTVLDTALTSLSGDGSGRDKMIGAVLLFGDLNDLEVRASRGFIAKDSSVHLPAEKGVLAKALNSGEVQFIEKPSEDPELSSLITLQDYNVALCLPLIRAMNAFGVMVFAHTDAAFFNQDRMDTLQMMGNQAVISLQNARLYQALAREKERIVQTQEEAQKKLARDLHDGPTQSVSAIAMRINIARKMMERSPQEALEELVRVEDLARRTTQEIRHMLFTLRPLVLETEGLIPALCTMAEKMHDLYQQNVFIDADEYVVSRLDMNQQTVVFYLTEEAVNNARKHAEANEISVRIKNAGKLANVALLEIADNGVGFDVNSVMSAYDRRGSLGMINLRERAELINGLFKIESVPGRGTCVRVFIPLDEEAADRLRNGR